MTRLLSGFVLHAVHDIAAEVLQAAYVCDQGRDVKAGADDHGVEFQVGRRPRPPHRRFADGEGVPGGGVPLNVEHLRVEGDQRAEVEGLAVVVEVVLIPHHETFRTTIQSPYSSIKG